ncbi:MAG: protein-L-isoaspartate(D-aspartate) O-methyltransferase [Thermovirga sp.]|nr:protein-L-isoaspartate(D-aspartate) O-methyltransferase [Thermovirga sp.]
MAILGENWVELSKRMVREQIAARGILNSKVLDALTKVPRHLFVPSDLQFMAYDDCPLPIGYDQTISQPYMVARMTELLDPKPGEKILEIGTGSGYQAAILAYLGVEVFSIERIDPLVERARRNLKRVGLKASIFLGDGTLGLPGKAPFDAIIVTAASAKVSEAWEKQLKGNGRILLPLHLHSGVERLLLRVYKREKIEEKWYDYCRFVPLLPGLEKLD